MLHSAKSEWENRRFERSGGEHILKDGVTYVWWINLQVVSEIVDSVTRLLSAEERNRADRIADNEVYREFVVTRSAARLLLASCTGRAPEELPLVTGRYGKLAVDEIGLGIEFNVSHSHGLALICLSRDRHVGVDLEYIRNMADLDLMGTLTLTAGERAAISADSEPLEAFFRCWVRKEAVVKAAGLGLSASLCDVEVTTSDRPVAVRLRNAQDRPAKYEVINLEAPRGYKAAIACERSIGDLVVKTWRWS
jgi:4'-phosphopantetheinyl transferase